MNRREFLQSAMLGTAAAGATLLPGRRIWQVGTDLVRPRSITGRITEIRIGGKRYPARGGDVSYGPIPNERLGFPSGESALLDRQAKVFLDMTREPGELDDAFRKRCAERYKQNNDRIAKAHQLDRSAAMCGVIRAPGECDQDLHNRMLAAVVHPGYFTDPSGQLVPFPADGPSRVVG